jgi:hypothetical protein
MSESEQTEATQTKTIVPIKQGQQFQLLHHAHNTHCAVVDQYMTVEQLQDPKFWSFVASAMKHMDRIQVTAKDGSMIAFGLVVFAQGSIIKVKFYEHFDLELVKQPEIKMQGFIIRLIGPASGWEIIDERSGEQLKGEGLENQGAAIKYLQDHLKHKVA